MNKNYPQAHPKDPARPGKPLATGQAPTQKAYLASDHHKPPPFNAAAVRKASGRKS